jgi:hypothetical protein
MVRLSLFAMLVISTTTFAQDRARLLGNPIDFGPLKVSSVILSQRTMVLGVLKEAGLDSNIRFYRAGLVRSLEDSSEKIVYTLQVQTCKSLSQTDSCVMVGNLLIQAKATQGPKQIGTTFEMEFQKSDRILAFDEPIYEENLVLASVILQQNEKISNYLESAGISPGLKFSRGVVEKLVPQTFSPEKMTLETKMCSDPGVMVGCYWVFNLIIERKGSGDEFHYEITFKGSGLG